MSKQQTEAKATEAKPADDVDPIDPIDTPVRDLDAVRLPDNTVVGGKPANLPEGPIDVVATERGYYNDRIIEPDTKFTIASAEEWGGWMRLASEAKQAE